MVNAAREGQSQEKLWWRLAAILTRETSVILGFLGERQTEPPHTWFSPQWLTGTQQLHQVKRMFGGIGNMLFSTFSQAS